ncbi:hypothetical protein M6B38_143260 [Iris pallida]|uniref:Uncharacterized protein n=1 Tax=Iris pallida TaxID=29817 RepID=A0AAX6FBF1_IRIPA|nr:hypothetical protein M6B38_143260 [Iris pallida]
MSLSGWPLSFLNVMLSVTGAQVGTIPDPIFSQGSCDERLFSLHVHFSMVRLPYCVLSLSLIVAYFIFSIIWHVDVSCYVPLRTWLSRQVCALMISADAQAKAMTCALFIEMLLLDRHLLALLNSFPCIFRSY